MTGGAFKYRPFTFDRSFDEAEIERAREAALVEEKQREEEERQAELERNPPPPTYSVEELEASRSAAFEEGRQQGVQETHESLEAQILAALQTITGQLAVLHDRQALANETISSQMARITGDIIERLLPEFVRRHGDDEILSLVRECLEPLEDAGRVMIHVPEAGKEEMVEKLQQAAQESGFEGRLLVKGDEALGPSDVRIDWGQGGTERNMDEIWQTINQAIDHCVKHVAGLHEESTAEPLPEGEISAPQEAVIDQEQDLEADLTISNTDEGQDAQTADLDISAEEQVEFASGPASLPEEVEEIQPMASEEVGELETAPEPSPAEESPVEAEPLPAEETNEDP